MRKRLILFLAILAIAAVCVYAQNRKRQGVTMKPGDTAVIGTSGELVVIEPIFYWYKPQADITTYELALLLPLFSGPSYGLGEWSSMEAVIVPMRDRQHGGWPAFGTVLRIDEWKAKDLGTAMRHFVKLPLGDK